MTKYIKINVKLINTQINKLKDAIKMMIVLLQDFLVICLNMINYHMNFI